MVERHTIGSVAWDGAAEVLAVLKAVPVEHRLDAMALAVDACAKTRFTLEVDAEPGDLDAARRFTIHDRLLDRSGVLTPTSSAVADPDSLAFPEGWLVVWEDVSDG